MKKLLFLIAGISTIAAAEDVRDSDRIVCATQEVILCVEHGDCFNLIPDDLSIPDFLVIDLKEKTLSTTDASPNPRTSEIDNLKQEGIRTYLQGVENERAYSLAIEMDTGLLTGSVLRDGVTVSVFGACTDADL